MRVDPLRVRLARIEAGLSVAALAGTEASRALITLIERGGVQPSAKLLQLIAVRTNRPVEYFLDNGDRSAEGELPEGGWEPVEAPPDPRPRGRRSPSNDSVRLRAQVAKLAAENGEIKAEVERLSELFARLKRLERRLSRMRLGGVD